MYNILLLGDSLIADYDWQAHLPSYRVRNFGVPGATSADLLSSLTAISGRADAVDVIMIMIGTNDLLSGRQDRVVDNLKSILVQARQDYPKAEILVNSLFPMDLAHLPAGSVEELNHHIASLTTRTGCCYLDTHRRFVLSGKQLFQADGVHITAAAYALWTRCLLEHLAFLLESD